MSFTVMHRRPVRLCGQVTLVLLADRTATPTGRPILGPLCDKVNRGHQPECYSTCRPTTHNFVVTNCDKLRDILVLGITKVH